MGQLPKDFAHRVDDFSGVADEYVGRRGLSSLKQFGGLLLQGEVGREQGAAA